MMTKDNLRKLTGDERLGQMRDSEYLGAEDIDDDVTDAMNSILGTQPEAPVQEAPQAPQMQSQMQEAAPQENPSSMSLSAAVNAAAPAAPAAQSPALGST